MSTSYCESCKRDLFTKYFSKTKDKCAKRCKYCVSQDKRIKTLEETIIRHYDSIYPEGVLTVDHCVGMRVEEEKLAWRQPGYSYCGPQQENYQKELLVYKTWIVENYQLRLDEIKEALNNLKVSEWLKS